MQIGPKYKICRRLGSSIFEKCQTQKFALREERKTKTFSRGRSRSNFALQLLEKQKARFTYGISEKQFSRYVKEATDGKESPAEALFARLEERLDNTIFRLGLAKSRRMARQMVSHGHVRINGKRLKVPSHRVKKGDVLSIREGSRDSGLFRELEELQKHYKQPTWLSFNEKTLDGNVEGSPTYEPTEQAFDLTKVLEFYSR